MFSRMLTEAISHAQGKSHPLAVAFLDLDRFKLINDTLGHEAGDHLLKTVAERLKLCVRPSDTVARLGGDEFVVLLPHFTHTREVTDIAEKILAVIAQPFRLLGQEFRITASIGISAYPDHGLDEQTLKKNADIAMYHAKTEGKNNFQVYTDRMNANSLERLALESNLRHALERNEFRLYYQAKRSLDGGAISGMEVLLRWEHPDLGTVAPLQFITLAEETGLIIPIGRWVLRTACAQYVEWRAAGMPSLSIAVNLGARQFIDENLLSDVAQIIRETGMDPRFLEIEISERLLIHDVEWALQVITALKSLGIRIAIDDFGTGYTTLNTLQKFPLDTIKINQSFIRGVTSEGANAGLTDAIISMSKSLSLNVVAQGVETSEQAEFLRAHACDELQGFYFNRPLDADDFSKLLLAPTSDVTYIGKRLGIKAG
jgi:diguanylate cyclase (GGDEF)-like protein